MSSDVKARLKPIYRRPSSSSAPAKSPLSATASTASSSRDRSWSKSSLRSKKAPKALSNSTGYEFDGQADQCPPVTPARQRLPSFAQTLESSDTDLGSSEESPSQSQNPKVVIERPTPERGRSSELSDIRTPSEGDGAAPESRLSPKRPLRPTIAVRRHSPISDGHNRLFSALYNSDPPLHRPSYTRQLSDPSERNVNMNRRKIWVKRPGSSPTQVIIGEEDLVDDVRDMILKKYTNSLGRNFDSPDVTLRLVHRKYSARQSSHERMLGPEEVICKLLDVYYPGGQAVEEALIIDVPQRRTPKHSPRLPLPYYMNDTLRPGENGSDYFPPMALAAPHSPQVTSNLSAPNNQNGPHRSTPHSISVLETGQLPDLPSPGSRMTRHSHRPKNTRTHTTSPTVTSGLSNPPNHDLKAPKSQPIHTPPITGLPPDLGSHKAITPPPRNSSPRPKATKRSRKSQAENTSTPTSNTLLDNAVPPINVLIVEDNIINLKLLEAFLKRLKVRWSTAMNGRDAVTRWRKGGFHLVLMDIQLPVMSGLEATKEIRRLERVNDIGVFSNSPSSTPAPVNGEKRTSESNGHDVKNEDTLQNIALFKSSVIIVALTASSLQSDRHEALAAGCNDFLTKPVSFDWLSRKVMEWGCMQALIDFDGWRKWKGLGDPAKTAQASSGLKTTEAKSSPFSANLPPSANLNKSGNSGSATGSNGTVVAVGTGAGGAGGSGKKKFGAHVLDGLDESKERSTSDEADNGTDTNGEDGSGAEIAVGA